VSGLADTGIGSPEYSVEGGWLRDMGNGGIGISGTMVWYSERQGQRGMYGRFKMEDAKGVAHSFYAFDQGVMTAAQAVPKGGELQVESREGTKGPIATKVNGNGVGAVASVGGGVVAHATHNAPPSFRSNFRSGENPDRQRIILAQNLFNRVCDLVVHKKGYGWDRARSEVFEQFNGFLTMLGGKPMVPMAVEGTPSSPKTPESVEDAT